MTKTFFFLMAVILGTFVGLSSPALAGKGGGGGGGGGQNAGSNHTSTGSTSGKQTPANKVILHVRKAGGTQAEIWHWH
jgi:hypothetical protein